MRHVVKIGEKYDFCQHAGKDNVGQLLPLGNADILKSQQSLYHNCGIYAAAAIAACAESTELMVQCSLRRQNL